MCVHGKMVHLYVSKMMSNALADLNMASGEKHVCWLPSVKAARMAGQMEGIDCKGLGECGQEEAG